MTACINLQEVVRPSWFSETNHHRNVPHRDSASRPSTQCRLRSRQWPAQSVSGFEFGRELYKTELIQLQSWLSLFGRCTLFSIGCICLFYEITNEITNEIPWFRVILRIPFQVGNSASFPRSRKITGPTYSRTLWFYRWVVDGAVCWQGRLRVSLQVKVKARDLRGKKKDELEKQLGELKTVSGCASWRSL